MQHLCLIYIVHYDIIYITTESILSQVLLKQIQMLFLYFTIIHNSDF